MLLAQLLVAFAASVDVVPTPWQIGLAVAVCTAARYVAFEPSLVAIPVVSLTIIILAQVLCHDSNLPVAVEWYTLSLDYVLGSIKELPLVPKSAVAVFSRRAAEVAPITATRTSAMVVSLELREMMKQLTSCASNRRSTSRSVNCSPKSGNMSLHARRPSYIRCTSFNLVRWRPQEKPCRPHFPRRLRNGRGHGTSCTSIQGTMGSEKHCRSFALRRYRRSKLERGSKSCFDPRTLLACCVAGSRAPSRPGKPDARAGSPDDSSVSDRVSRLCIPSHTKPLGIQRSNSARREQCTEAVCRCKHCTGAFH